MLTILETHRDVQQREEEEEVEGKEKRVKSLVR